MHRISISGGVNRNCGNAKLFGRAQNAQGDFAAIGNEDLVEHVVLSEAVALFDHQHGLAIFDGLTVFDKNGAHCATARRNDFVKRLHRFDQQNLFARFHG